MPTRNDQKEWWSTVPSLLSGNAGSSSDGSLAAASRPFQDLASHAQHGNDEGEPYDRFAEREEKDDDDWLGNLIKSMSCCVHVNKIGESPDDMKPAPHIPMPKVAARSKVLAYHTHQHQEGHHSDLDGEVLPPNNPEKMAHSLERTSSLNQPSLERALSDERREGDKDWIAGLAAVKQPGDVKKMVDKNKLALDTTRDMVFSIEAKLKEHANKGQTIEYEKCRKQMRVLQDQVEDLSFKQRRLIAQHEKAAIVHIANKNRDDLGSIDDYYAVKAINYTSEKSRSLERTPSMPMKINAEVGRTSSSENVRSPINSKSLSRSQSVSSPRSGSLSTSRSKSREKDEDDAPGDLKQWLAGASMANSVAGAGSPRMGQATSPKGRSGSNAFASMSKSGGARNRVLQTPDVM